MPINGKELNAQCAEVTFISLKLKIWNIGKSMSKPKINYLQILLSLSILILVLILPFIFQTIYPKREISEKECFWCWNKTEVEAMEKECKDLCSGLYKYYLLSPQFNFCTCCNPLRQHEIINKTVLECIIINMSA